jgi:hypothetical protein
LPYGPQNFFFIETKKQLMQILVTALSLCLYITRVECSPVTASIQPAIRISEKGVSFSAEVQKLYDNFLTQTSVCANNAPAAKALVKRADDNQIEPDEQSNAGPDQ